VEHVFLIVVIAVAAVGVAGAVASLVLGRRSWDRYGADALLKDSAGRDPRRPAAPQADAALRDEELRQMLGARNDRRRRQGEPLLDVEAELARLNAPATRPAADSALREEIRGLVLARNARRLRRGEPPLDIEAEIDRRIAELNL
jgi:hypothetical protein